MGPLYGIIRDNSTFGEVVFKGDSTRKRWLRLRPHIQRPSEISFFVQNRGTSLRRWEALIRWGSGLLTVLALSGGSFFLLVALISYATAAGGATVDHSVAEVIYVWCQTAHAIGLSVAILTFSHSRNTTYLRQSFPILKDTTVSVLDTGAFLVMLLFSLTLAIGTPYYIKSFVPGASGLPLFQQGSLVLIQQSGTDLRRVWLEGITVLTVAGIAIYALHRMMCLRSWQKIGSFIGVAFLYFVLICIAPLFLAMFILEFRELQQYRLLQDWAPSLAMCSPVTVFTNLYDSMGSRFPPRTSSLPFYLTHAAIFVMSVIGIRIHGSAVHETYLPGSSEGVAT